MRRTWLVSAFLLILALALAGCGSSAASIQPQYQVASTPIGSLIVTTQIPESMRVGQSYIVRMTLAPQGEYSTLSDIPVEKVSTITSGATPVGTPSAALQSALGPGYEPYAKAQLAGGSFDLQMVGEDTQSLRQPQVTWEWNVTPLSSGTQLIDAAITVEWAPTSSSSHTLPLTPTFTIASVDTPVVVLAAASAIAGATPTGGPSVTHIGPLLIDTTSLTTGILTSLLVALALSLMGFLFVRMRKLWSKVPTNAPRK